MTKRILAVLLALLLAMSAMPAAFAEVAQAKAGNVGEALKRGAKIETEGNVYLHSGPGASYSRIGAVEKNNRLKLKANSRRDGKGMAWYKVTFYGKTGWISSKYAHRYVAKDRKIVATSKAQLHATPKLSGDVIVSAVKGSSMTYMGKRKKDGRGIMWYRAWFRGWVGWVSGENAVLK